MCMIDMTYMFMLTYNKSYWHKNIETMCISKEAETVYDFLEQVDSEVLKSYDWSVHRVEEVVQKSEVEDTEYFNTLVE